MQVALNVITMLRILLIFLLAPTVVLAQDHSSATPAVSQAGPLIAHNKIMYAGLKKILLASAEKMPEANYAFKPTDSVRTFGQVIGHVADSQYTFCASALAEKRPAIKVEQTRITKAELIAALNDAFTYCDKAYDSVTDTSAAEMVKVFGQDTPRLAVLGVNNAHGAEHYGNLVTYLRMKDLVPPTSDPVLMKQMGGK